MYSISNKTYPKVFPFVELEGDARCAGLVATSERRLSTRAGGKGGPLRGSTGIRTLTYHFVRIRLK